VSYLQIQESPAFHGRGFFLAFIMLCAEAVWVNFVARQTRQS